MGFSLSDDTLLGGGGGKALEIFDAKKAPFPELFFAVYVLAFLYQKSAYSAAVMIMMA